MVFAGIVAGGSGTRMGGELPKQFLPLGGSSVLLFTAERFLAHPSVDAVIVGINPEWRDYAQKQIVENFLHPEQLYLVDGGQDRNSTVSHMVRFARQSLGGSPEDIILTHDAVRPFVTPKMIGDSIAAMSYCDICTTVIPETDTVVISSQGHIAEEFPDRSALYRVQTPQTFRLGTFDKVYGALSDQEKRLATDVCRLYLQNGYQIHLIPGDPSNLKLTYPSDYQIALATLQQTDFS